MSDPIDDAAFEEYLKGGSRESQRYREIGGGEVPPELDRRILQQAHAAAGRRPARSRAWMRWSAPLALVASVVLVVSIVMNSGVQQKTVVLSMPQAAAPDAAAEAEHRNEVPHAPPGDEPGELTYVLPVAPPAPMLAPPPEVAVPVERAPAAVARSRQAPRGDVEAKRAEASAAKAAAAETSEITVTGNRLRDVSPPSPVHVDIPIDMPSQAITQTTSARKQPDTAAPHSVDLDPQRWLEHIRQLRKEGKSTEADREWERFRAAFPDYAVADDDAARKKEADSG